VRRALACLVVLAGLVEAQTLTILHPTLHHRQEDGAVLPEGYRYVSGELLYLSFRIGGFKVEKDHVDLRWQVVATDAEGLLLAPPANGAVREEVTDNDKNWLPKVQFTLPLPGQLQPGSHKLKILVADELAGKNAEAEVQFAVGGQPLPKVDGLTILGVGFYKSETDRQPLSPAAYHVGETLLARFQVAGFQLADKNKFAIDYGLQVLSASGKVLFTQDPAASDSGEPFYPRRLLHGALTLTLNAGVQPADYTLLIIVRDHISGKQTETRAAFSVNQ